ncbi:MULTISPECIES: cutinase family protein [Microbacteriaceae]|jgi:cutinase|uniref:cutinase family protein n=1 Tax=Microbacteriaceae TaxID=85023 RepID=UPI0016251038|nr:cutinase family protein [Glaciihabitans sp. INWT7]QNE46148.1 cutinase family protein [Glaciihabitans sp. INWT7]
MKINHVNQISRTKALRFAVPFVVFGTLLSIMIGGPASATTASVPCGGGAYNAVFIGVRGSLEPVANPQLTQHSGRVYQSGGMGTRIGAVGSYLASNPNIPTFFEGIVYPATVISTQPSDFYPASIAAGTAALVAEVNYIASICPYSPIILAGYSQGAQVIGNALDPTTTPNGGISAAGRSSVVSIVLLADPSYVPNQPWNVYTHSPNNGAFHRGGNAFASWTHISWDTGSPVSVTSVKSYCLPIDEWCQSGGFAQYAVNVHNNGYSAGTTPSLDAAAYITLSLTNQN